MLQWGPVEYHRKSLELLQEASKRARHVMVQWDLLVGQLRSLVLEMAMAACYMSCCTHPSVNVTANKLGWQRVASVASVRGGQSCETAVCSLQMFCKLSAGSSAR